MDGSVKTWPVFATDMLASYGPLLMACMTFDDLVAHPVHNLGYTLPITLFLTLLPVLLQHGLAPVLQSLGLLLLYFFPSTYSLVVLMGAPFTTHVAETLLFSGHLTVMVFFKAITKFGLEKSNWIPLVPFVQDDDDDTTDAKRAMDKRVGGTGLEGVIWGTLAGAYLGAIPIPLDWDREWQKWPVTVHAGACLGLAIGTTIQILFDSFRRSSKAMAKSTKKNN